jgi:hypothetical protein
VAGVQDMRFQELMPDVLHWLGVRRIHRLVSMSNMKYDAITGSGIEVGERVKIPDELIPADAQGGDGRQDRPPATSPTARCPTPSLAQTSRAAKDRGADSAPCAAHCCAPRTTCASAAPRAGGGPAGESPGSRSTARRAWTRRPPRGGRHARRYPDAGHSLPQPLAPLRGRRRRPQGGSRRALAGRSPPNGRARWIDLTVVSVLLDAGAGAAGATSRRASGQTVHARSEGLGVASFHAFVAGLFSSDRRRPLRWTRQACAAGRPRLAAPSRPTPGNPLVGLDGRAALLRRLGAALQAESPRCSASARAARAAVRPADRAGAHAAEVAAHDILAPAAGDAFGRSGPRQPWRACRWATAGGTARRGPTAPDRRLGAVPQAVAVAHLFAAGAVCEWAGVQVTAWTR